MLKTDQIVGVNKKHITKKLNRREKTRGLFRRYSLSSAGSDQLQSMY